MAVCKIEFNPEDGTSKVTHQTWSDTERREKSAKLVGKICDENKWQYGMICDKYHTFDELYHHRAMLFASLCLTTFYDYAWKSLLHHDSENEPMYEGMFIVGVSTPYGEVSYHYDIDPYWKVFKDIKELDNAPEYTGYTPDESIHRLFDFARQLGHGPNLLKPRKQTTPKTVATNIPEVNHDKK